MLTSRIIYKPDDPPAGAPPTDPPASPPPAAPPVADNKTAWEAWLEKQPEEVRKMYGEHTTGLTSALDKERQARKENEKQLKKLADLEAAEQKRRDADKTELEKIQDALKVAEEKARKLELIELQRQAAETHKLPAALATRLQGETLAELEADAAELVKTLPKPSAPQVSPTNPGGNADGNGETDDQRRARLYGSNADLYNPSEAAKHGGGVHFHSKE